MTYNNGDKFEGQFENDMKQGKGTLRLIAGVVY